MSFSTVADVMNPKVIYVNDTDSITTVIELFESAHISGVPVKNQTGEVVGVISKTDIVSEKLYKYFEASSDLNTIKVSEFMNPNAPVTVHQSKPLDDAITLMIEHHIHRVFVCGDDGEITGIVTTFDIVKQMRFAFESYI